MRAGECVGNCPFEEHFFKKLFVKRKNVEELAEAELIVESGSASAIWHCLRLVETNLKRKIGGGGADCHEWQQQYGFVGLLKSLRLEV